MNGIELARRLWADAVEPILSRRFPDVDVAAALLGYGSEVLGLDDELSQDHHWGPRLLLFVREPALEQSEMIRRALADELPYEVAGIATNFGPPTADGARMPLAIKRGPVDHRVEVHAVGEFMSGEIGFDPLQPISVEDWLLTPTQQLLQVTAGEVFSDACGELTAARETLRWYPRDIWLLTMAGEWRRVSQLEHLMGRAGSRGDDLGSRLICARLVEALMRIGFLQERNYPRIRSGLAVPTRSSNGRSRFLLKRHSQRRTGVSVRVRFARRYVPSPSPTMSLPLRRRSIPSRVASTRARSRCSMLTASSSPCARRSPILR